MASLVQGYHVSSCVENKGEAEKYLPATGPHFGNLALHSSSTPVTQDEKENTWERFPFLIGTLPHPHPHPQVGIRAEQGWLGQMEAGGPFAERVLLPPHFS